MLIVGGILDNFRFSRALNLQKACTFLFLLSRCNFGK